MTHWVRFGKWEMMIFFPSPKKHFRDGVEIYFNKVNAVYVVTVLLHYCLLSKPSNFF